jgi:hypothetical protein
MATQLEEYKAFVDDIVAIRRGAYENWMLQAKWPPLPEEQAHFKGLLDAMTPAEREMLATIVRQAREGGIFDTLRYLNEQMTLFGMKIVRNGTELAVEPYGTELYYDWICRCAGDEWPEFQLRPEYRE